MIVYEPRENTIVYEEVNDKPKSPKHRKECHSYVVGRRKSYFDFHFVFQVNRFMDRPNPLDYP